MNTTMEKIRIDKWLWAARFFKTRNLAKHALESGKVKCNGNSIKASKDINCGMLLTIRQGFDVKEVTVIALSDQRRGAPEAALLYQETEASIKKREDMAAQRKTLSGTGVITEGRPSKKQRRQIHRFKDLLNDE